MTSPLDNSLNNKVQNFFDLNSLNNITLQSKSTDKASKKAALEAAAKQFEAIFMQMLLKSMRQAQDVLESDSPFNSQTTKFYRDMHDQQLAVELSQNGTLGLSELIVRQLGGEQDNFKPSSVIRSDGNLEKVAASQLIADEKSVNQVLSQLQDSLSKAPSQLPLSASVSNNRQADIPFQAVFDELNQSNHFAQPEDFVSALITPAKRAEKALGVPYQVVIAQAALETGWGKKVIKTQQGESSNNLFNIKADKRWQGDKVVKETLEFEQGTMVKKHAPFRVYDSLAASVDDYINFLTTNPRYQKALEQTSNVEHFLHGIQKAGYATDPQYANKILNTLKSVTRYLAQ